MSNHNKKNPQSAHAQHVEVQESTHSIQHDTNLAECDNNKESTQPQHILYTPNDISVATHNKLGRRKPKAENTRTDMYMVPNNGATFITQIMPQLLGYHYCYYRYSCTTLLSNHPTLQPTKLHTHNMPPNTPRSNVPTEGLRPDSTKTLPICYNQPNTTLIAKTRQTCTQYLAHTPSSHTHIQFTN